MILLLADGRDGRFLSFALVAWKRA